MSSNFYTQAKKSWGRTILKQKLQIRQKKQSMVDEQSKLVLHDMLRQIISKQLRYPFQLLKQYFLFPDGDEDSIQVTYKHMRYEMEIAIENIKAVTGLMRQRSLIDGFVTIKNAYTKKLRIEAAYHSIQNLVHFTKVVVTIENILKVQMKWEGFRKLYENIKRLKLSKISVSKISMISNELTSKEFDDIHPFFIGKGRMIDDSFIMDTSNFHGSQQSESNANRSKQDVPHRSKKQIKENINHKGKEVIRRKTERKSMTSGSKNKKKNEQKGNYLVQKKSYRHNSPLITEEDEVKNKKFLTQKKQKTKQHSSANKPCIQIKQPENQTQQIFLIHNYHSKTKAPSNFIKIPVVSQNIKIIQINTGRRKREEKKEDYQFDKQQNSCENCKYCRLMRERQQIMRMVEQKLTFSNNKDPASRLQTDNLLSSITFHSRNDHDYGTSPSTQQMASTSRIYNKYSSSTLNKQYPSTSIKQHSTFSKKLDFTPHRNIPSPSQQLGE